MGWSGTRRLLVILVFVAILMLVLFVFVRPASTQMLAGDPRVTDTSGDLQSLISTMMT